MAREEVRISEQEMERHYAGREPYETAAMRAGRAYEEAHPERRVVGCRSTNAGFWLLVAPRPQ